MFDLVLVDQGHFMTKVPGVASTLRMRSVRFGPWVGLEWSLQRSRIIIIPLTISRLQLVDSMSHYRFYLLSSDLGILILLARVVHIRPYLSVLSLSSL